MPGIIPTISLKKTRKIVKLPKLSEGAHIMKNLLDKLRHPGRTKSIVAYILFGAIIVVFVFFFQSGPLRDMGGGGSAAIVNDQVIPLSDFRTRVQRQEEQLKMRMDGLPDSQRQLFSDAIRRRAMDDLVMAEVLAQSAHQFGFSASDSEVRDRILEIPQFQVEGRFRRDRYEDLLKANHLNTREFEEKIRKDVMSQKVQVSFSRALYPTLDELEKEKRLRELQLNVAFVEYDKSSLTSNFKPSADEIKAYLASPEGKAASEAYFAKNKTTFFVPEQVRAQHILIKATPGDKTSEEESLKKIKDIAERSTKEDFGKLAQELSQDEGSKVKQGDLDYFGRGHMVKEFETAAFALKAGEISPPVKTPFGYHLIKVNDHRKGGEKAFEEVAENIAGILLAEQQFAKANLKLEELTKARGEQALSAYLKPLKVEWQETGDFALGLPQIPRIGDKEKIVTAALSLENPGAIYPEVLQVSGKYYIIKLKSKKVKRDENADKLSYADEARYIAARKTGGVFEDWLSSRRELFKISTNSKLFKEETQ
jgi:peptidyl-prolyl cis-trans isomerase D